MNKLYVTFFTGIEGYSPVSMKVYKKNLLNKLKKNHSGIYYTEVNSIFLRVPLLKGLINRYFIYFLSSRNKFSINNHILDHANSALLLMKPKGAKCIITCHDVINFIYEKNNFFNNLIRSGLRKADLIIADSENTKNDLINLLKIPHQKIKVIHLGIDQRIFVPKDKSKARELLKLEKDVHIILHVGSEIERKNVQFLLKAFSEVRKKIPNSILIRVGSPSSQSIELIKKLNIEKNIKYYSNIEDSKLALFYSSADVFVFPSLYEGFGFPVLEAMASGCPVISSNTSSIPEITSDAAKLINPYDLDDLSSSIIEVIMNKNLKEKMIKKGVKQAKKFTWEKTAQKTLKTYFSVFKYEK